MGFESLANSITTYFQSVMDAYGYTARYDDDPRATPTSGLWCEVGIDFGDSNQKEIGINSTREIGNLTVRIKQESGLGLNNLLIVADRIASAFKNTDVNSIVLFKVPRIIKNGRIDDNFQVTVICPFHYDEVSFVGNSFASLFDTPADFSEAGGYYAKVKDDETGLEFEASDVGWVHRRPSINIDSIRAAGVPTQVEVGAFLGYSLPIWNAGGNSDEELRFRQLICGVWDGVSNIHFHITAALSASEDVGDKFKFQLSWNRSRHSEIVPVTFNDLTAETTVLTGRNSQYDVYDISFEIPYIFLLKGDLLGARLRRVAASSLEVSNELILWCWHIDFKSNKIVCPTHTVE